MSFSGEQKREIAEQPMKSACCRRAFLQGVLAAKGEISDNTVRISAETREYAEFISGLVEEIYGKKAEIMAPDKGGRCKIVRFSSPSATKYIQSLSSDGASCSVKCALCNGAFLRGIFFAAGRVSDPAKQYSLEFSPRGNFEGLLSVLEKIGLTPRVSVKPNEKLIYFRNSAMIEDFFALAGMNNTVFSLMNAKIQGEIRNNVNRIANCETNNIDKAVSASISQIGLIEALVEKGLISQLPDELEKTARLRMEYKDLSIAQLALMITPRISKPGLSHRLKKITEIARNLLEGKKSNP